MMDLVNKDKEYKSNNTSVYSCQYHVIFCPKYRRKVLINSIDLRIKEIILEQQTKFHYQVLEIEVMPDHVHLLLDLNPKIGIIKTIKNIKGSTSKILREEFPELKSKLPCLWSRTKFISTVGSVSLEVVKKYIENQKNV